MIKIIVGVVYRYRQTYVSELGHTNSKSHLTVAKNLS